MRRVLVAAAVTVACGSKSPSSPVARDAAADSTISFAWPAPATAIVHQRITGPRAAPGQERALTYDLRVEPSPSGLAIELSNFRAGVRDGKATRVDHLGLTSAQPVLASAIASGRLRFEVTAAGDLAGSPAVDDTVAMIDRMTAAPPGGMPVADVERLAAIARAAVDTPAVRNGVTAHVTDLWATWAWLWIGLGTLPDPGAEVTRDVLGLPVTVRVLGAGRAPGTVRVEARTRRAATTEVDLGGPRTWFVAVGPRAPIDLETTYHLTVTAELEPRGARPREVTLEAVEDVVGRHGDPHRWRYEYQFTW